MSEWTAPKAIARGGTEVIHYQRKLKKVLSARFWQVAVKELAMTNNPLVDIKTVRLFILCEKVFEPTT